jgi:hypothetical protein
VSVRCCVRQVVPLAFALVVDAGEEVACFEAAGAGVLDDAGAWVLGDAVEVWTLDELDEVGLDVEEHPVRNDVVIIISPATIGIEFFISPTNRQRWEHYTTMTHQTPEPGNVTQGLGRHRWKVSGTPPPAALTGLAGRRWTVPVRPVNG